MERWRAEQSRTERKSLNIAPVRTGVTESHYT